MRSQNDTKKIDNNDLQNDFIAAVKNGDYVKVKSLVKQKKVDINAVSAKTGNTALLIALKNDENEIANFLINHGADVNKASNKTGDTPLILAVKNEDVKLVKKLIKNGASTSAVNKMGFSPVMFAEEIKKGKKIVIKKNFKKIEMPLQTVIKKKLIKKDALSFGALPYDEALKNQGFILKKRLKLHVSGAIGKYKYVGNDPDIKKFLGDKNSLILKTPTIVDSKNEFNMLLVSEFNNADFLKSKEGGHDVLNRPSLLAINIKSDDGNIPVIINEHLFSNEKQNKTKDVEQYLTELGSLHKHKKAIINPPNFDAMFQSMNEAQQQLHRDGLLHLDTACRNFVIDMKTGTVKIIDFGLSLKMDANGEAINDPHFKRIPAGFYDNAAQNVAGTKSIHTDLHSLKLTMIESLFHYINQNMSFARDSDNEKSLKNAVDSLKNALNNITDARKEVVINVLKKYEPYLTYSSVDDNNKIAQTIKIRRDDSQQTNANDDLSENKNESDNAYANESFDQNVGDDNTYANESGGKDVDQDNAYANDSNETDVDEDNAYANDSNETDVDQDNAYANVFEENESVSEVTDVTEGMNDDTDSELSDQDESDFENEHEDEQKDSYRYGNKDQLADDIMKADQARWVSVLSVKKGVNDDHQHNNKVKQGASSTATMINLMGHAPPAIVSNHHNDNKSAIIAILEQHFMMYHDKKKSFSLFNHEGEFKKLLSDVKEAISDSERIKLVENNLSKAYENYSNKHNNSTINDYVSELNASDDSNHYPRLLALSLQEVYQKCKTPSAQQLQGVNKIESYQEISARIRNEEKNHKNDNIHTPRLSR